MGGNGEMASENLVQKGEGIRKWVKIRKWKEDDIREKVEMKVWERTATSRWISGHGRREGIKDWMKIKTSRKDIRELVEIRTRREDIGEWAGMRTKREDTVRCNVSCHPPPDVGLTPATAPPPPLR